MTEARFQIVVVSPSEAARRLLQLLFQRLGHGCSVADDADHALHQVSVDKASVVVVDARAQEEDTLVLMGLLQKRFPQIPRLTLHEAEMQLSYSGTQRSFRIGSAPQLAFPSSQELEHVLSLLEAERMLAVLKPRVGSA
jgi:DNA-binding NtrC family response regulator